MRYKLKILVVAILGTVDDLTDKTFHGIDGKYRGLSKLLDDVTDDTKSVLSLKV